jgi:hypothetical protein
MRLVSLDQGVLQLAWSWMPLWLALNPTLQHELTALAKDVSLLNGLTASPGDLDALSAWVRRRLVAKYPQIQGLEAYLEALEAVRLPTA